MGRCCDHGVSPMCPAHLAVLYPTGGGVTLHGGAWGRGGDDAHSGFPYWENGCFHCRLTCPVCSLVSPWCTVRCRCASSGCVCVCVRGGTRVTRDWELRQHLLPGLPCEVYVLISFGVRVCNKSNPVQRESLHHYDYIIRTRRVLAR